MSEAFYKLTPEMARTLRENLTLSEWRLWSYLITLDPFGDRYLDLDTLTVMAECDCSKATFYRAVGKLKAQGLLPDWVVLIDKNCIESQIRDRLKSQLGGLTEVKTAAGRIDLLTETEIIEVKRVGEWKSGLGQLLVYSGFYPEHQKRLYLFGSAKDEKQIPTIANSCLAFDVFVSFEVVAEVKA
jgi:hypothetical protein